MPAAGIFGAARERSFTRRFAVAANSGATAGRAPVAGQNACQASRMLSTKPAATIRPIHAATPVIVTTLAM